MAIRFGSFELDTQARELRRGKQPVHLSPKAFELLLALARSQPRALSKRELKEQLWPDTVVVEASLANLVGELREALGETARRPVYVRTLQRFGYAFQSDPGTPPVEQPSEPAVVYRLIWPGGRTTVAEGEHVVGRDEQATIRLASASVSRQHACIRISEDGVVLEDLGSKNGTRIAGRRLTAAVRLSDGDAFHVGTVRVRLRILKRAGSTETAGRRSSR